MTNIYGKNSHINRVKATKYNNGLSSEQLREQRGKELYQNNAVKNNNNGTYTVTSSNLIDFYTVEFSLIADGNIISSCSCPDHQSRGSECKHIHAVKFFEKWK